MSKRVISNIFKIYIVTILILFSILQYLQIGAETKYVTLGHDLFGKKGCYIRVKASEKNFWLEKYLYVDGNEDTDGSIRFIKEPETGIAIIQKRVAGTWQLSLLKELANIGSMLIGKNTVSTVIVIKDTFVDLNLNGLAVEASNNNLWTLTNTTTGEMRYDGDINANLEFTGLVAAYSAGGTQRFNFRLLKNGSPLVAPDNIDIPIEIKANIASSPLLWSIMVSPGDKFRLQVENAEGTSDITIDTLKVTIR